MFLEPLALGSFASVWSHFFNLDDEDDLFSSGTAFGVLAFARGDLTPSFVASLLFGVLGLDTFFVAYGVGGARSWLGRTVDGISVKGNVDSGDKKRSESALT